MTVSLSSPITGATETGLTSPTYSFVTDQAPENNAKQVAISALGGTQTGVEVHSVAKPFTISHFKPKIFKMLGRVNPVTGQVSNVPMNVYKQITRKGVLVLADQPAVLARMTTIIEIPAGSDTEDPESLRAMQSAHIGALNQISSGFGDTTVNGVL